MDRKKNKAEQALTGNYDRDIVYLKEKAKSYENKPDGYLGIRECWKQIAIITMNEERKG